MGVLSNVEALELAVSVGLDLVEVSPSADPPAVSYTHLTLPTIYSV